MDVAVAPDAPPGAHKITLFVGRQAIPQGQTFFVQVPTSLAGTSFDGTSDKIGPSGAGPLHTPSFGPNDFVFDANGVIQDPQDTNPVCGVYRNSAFQLLDQDSPPQAIREDGIAVTEALSVGSPRTISTNNGGQVLDTHGLVSPDRCLSPNEFIDVTQSFAVGAAGRSFTLTTTMRIRVGNINGQLTETTEVTHQ